MVGKSKFCMALDIGSTKVALAIGVQKDRELDIIGVGKSAHTGTRQGFLLNIQETTDSILAAKREAFKSAGLKSNAIEDVFVGVSGSHILSHSSYGMAVIEEKAVSINDIKSVIRVAQASFTSNSRVLLHAIPKTFKIDDREGISDPMGMVGSRIESSVHLITASRTALDDIVNCCTQAGLVVRGFFYQPLAVAECVLSRAEILSGVTLIDMGRTSCNTLTLSDGVAIQTDNLSVGGAHFTHDLAMGLKITSAQAEAIKLKHGCAIADMINCEEEICVETLGGVGKVVDPMRFAEILEARGEETLTLLNEKINKVLPNFRPRSGVVFTGRAAQLRGFIDLAGMIFDEPVRLGELRNLKNFSKTDRDHGLISVIGGVIYASKNAYDRFEPIGKEVMSEKLSLARDQVKRYFENLF